MEFLGKMSGIAHFFVFGWFLGVDTGALLGLPWLEVLPGEPAR